MIDDWGQKTVLRIDQRDVDIVRFVPHACVAVGMKQLDLLAGLFKGVGRASVGPAAQESRPSLGAVASTFRPHNMLEAPAHERMRINYHGARGRCSLRCRSSADTLQQTQLHQLVHLPRQPFWTLREWRIRSAPGAVKDVLEGSACQIFEELCFRQRLPKRRGQSDDVLSFGGEGLLTRGEAAGDVPLLSAGALERRQLGQTPRGRGRDAVPLHEQRTQQLDGFRMEAARAGGIVERWVLAVDAKTR